MLGGYQILDLSTMSMTTGSDVTITDAYILNQLRILREYIDENNDYSKPALRKLKPVMLRVRNYSEKIDAVIQCNLTNYNVLTFYVVGRLIDNKIVRVTVTFEEVTDDDGNTYYDIDVAKLAEYDSVTNYLESVDPVTISGDLSVLGDLDVAGDISGNDASISGNLTVTGDISGDNITGDSIIENMNGYSVTIPSSIEDFDFTPVYAGAVKNGNKLTLVFSLKLKLTNADAFQKAPYVIDFNIPSAIGQKLITTQIDNAPFLDNKKIECFDNWRTSIGAYAWIEKQSNTKLQLQIDCTNFVVDTVYYVRYEVTFLLSDNLVSE